jgi:hypothetical protein
VYLNVRVHREDLNREVLERDLGVWCDDNYGPISTSSNPPAVELSAEPSLVIAVEPLLEEQV